MNKSLHILVVTRGLPFHSLGGMEAVAWDLSREFVKLGHQVTVLTTSCDKLKEKQLIDGVNIHCLNAPQGVYSKAWWNESARVFKEQYLEKVNVVLSVSAGAMSIAKVNTNPAIKFFVQAHGTSWGELISKLKQRTLISAMKAIKNLIAMIKDFQYRYFDAFVAIGSAVEQDLRKLPTKWIVGNLPVYLVPNGVDVKKFEFDFSLREKVRNQLNIGASQKVVFSACRLHEQKGVLEALQGFALAYQVDPSLRFIIAGNGPEEDDLKKAVVNLGIHQSVFFVGSVSRDNLKAYLSASDVFLFATKRVEGLPMNILEALASGLPVIVSKHIDHPTFNATAINPEELKSISTALLNTDVDVNRCSKLIETYALTFSAKKYISLFFNN